MRAHTGCSAYLKTDGQMKIPLKKTIVKNAITIRIFAWPTMYLQDDPPYILVKLKGSTTRNTETHAVAVAWNDNIINYNLNNCQKKIITSSLSLYS